MYCSSCGTENQAGSKYCQKCGAAISENEASAATDKTSIWNPNAAANWSLVFTPAFGSYIHMRNWASLGHVQKAAAAKRWFYASLALLGVYLILSFVVDDEKKAEVFARGLGFIFLLVWYFSAGRAQAKYVKATFGSSYLHKPWGKTLLVAVAAVIAYVLLASIVGVISASVT